MPGAQAPMGFAQAPEATLPTDAAAGPPTSAFSEFSLYAQALAGKNSAASLSGDAATLSAVLSNPAALDGKRAPCDAANPGVLIDLDIAGSRFSPDSQIVDPGNVAQELAALRAQDISVAWISGASAAYAGDVRAALKASGLDPEGKDEVLLMRYPGDRKQTRREELAASSCLVAIAGDERADFDELFGYLARPEAALGLDLLIGD
ncbi:MAG: hypothetical protein HRT64_02500, partial [Erythrobacter sp.]|nr:hypothetical protein [Erythrobacter sp.]